MQAPLPVPGATVAIRGRRWRVERAVREGTAIALTVTSRRGRWTFVAPFDRPRQITARSRLRRARRQQIRARLASLLAHTASLREPLAVLPANVRILAYQLEPVFALLHGTRRVLIADEVGLGKTIQAGLVIAELARRRPGLRALLIVPATLGEQWREELGARFRIGAQLADRAGLAHAERRGPHGENGWNNAGVWIASPDYLKQPHVIEHVPLRPWDVVVIDEAHEAAGGTARHAACHELARRARHVLLLSATPHTGDEARFARLLGIGALPDVDDDLAVFRRTRADTGQTRVRRVRWRRVRATGSERALVDELLAYERWAVRHGKAEVLLLLTVFRKRALSTAAALRRSVDRRLAWLDRHDAPRHAEQQMLDFDGEDREDDEAGCAALAADVGLPAADEREWLRRIVLRAAAAERHASKIEWLVRLIRNAREPVIVFTEFRDTLDALRVALERHHRVAWLHGQQPEEERSSQLGAFLRGRVTVLIATDVAGRGLNLHPPARWVVNFELPWNPARLEQRVGRVDRIGQARPVHATVLLSDHAAEVPLVESIARRTMSARRALGTSVLVDVAPCTDEALAASIWSRRPSDHANTIDLPQIPLCAAWRRAARAAAVIVSRKRQWSEYWRGDDAVDGIMRRGPGLADVPALAGRAVFIVTVPLIDGAGSEIERHLVALETPAGFASEKVAASVDALVGRRFERRRHRVERMARALAARAVRVEGAIAGHLHGRAGPREVQPAMFTAAALHRFEMGRDLAARIVESVDETRRDWESRSAIVVGSPRIALVLHKA